jgi:hypothetical protein
MQLSLKTLALSIHHIPFASGTEEYFKWSKEKHLDKSCFDHLDITSEGIGFKETFPEAAMNALGRGVITFIALPLINGVGALYNLSASMAKFSLAAITYLKNPKDESIPQDLKEGVRHLLTAVYDFTLCYFNYINGLIAIAYTLFPQKTEFYTSHMIFNHIDPTLQKPYQNDAAGLIDQATDWIMQKIHITNPNIN